MIGSDCVLGFTSVIYARGASFVRGYWIGSRWDLHDSLPAEKQSPWLGILPPVHFPDDDMSMMLLSEWRALCSEDPDWRFQRHGYETLRS